MLVLERRELVGGCAVTEEVWPGFRVSTAAYLTSLMQERMVRDLELHALRLPGGRQGPRLLLSLPGRPPLLHVAGPQRKTLEEIAKFSQQDADRLPAYEDQLERLSRVVEWLLLTTPPQLPARERARLPGLRAHRRARRAVSAARTSRRWSRSSPRARRISWTSGSNRRS